MGTDFRHIVLGDASPRPFSTDFANSRFAMRNTEERRSGCVSQCLVSITQVTREKVSLLSNENTCLSQYQGKSKDSKKFSCDRCRNRPRANPALQIPLRSLSTESLVPSEFPLPLIPSDSLENNNHMATIVSQAVISPMIGRLSPMIDHAQIPETVFIPLSKLLAEALSEHEELLTCLQSQVQEMRCVMRECETAVRRMKKMPIERLSAREIVKRENEALSSLWTADSLICELYSPTHKFIYALKLVGEFRTVFYKHKKFGYLLCRLRFQVVDEHGGIVHLQSSLHISISVYHSKAPLRKLTGKRISAGKQLLTGRKIITAAGTTDIVFDDLSFRWITSKIKPRWVVLVTQCSNVPEIRPCVIEGVHVKSPSNYLPQYATELFGPAVKTQDLCLG